MPFSWAVVVGWPLARGKERREVNRSAMAPNQREPTSGGHSPVTTREGDAQGVV